MPQATQPPARRPPNSQARHPQRGVRSFWKAVDGRQFDAIDQHRALELERLGALQLAVCDDAMAGEVKAAGRVLRITDTRIRLLGLDKVNGAQGAQTVVMSPAEVATWKETQEGKPEVDAAVA